MAIIPLYVKIVRSLWTMHAQELSIVHLWKVKVFAVIVWFTVILLIWE